MGKTPLIAPYTVFPSSQWRAKCTGHGAIWRLHNGQWTMDTLHTELIKHYPS